MKYMYTKNKMKRAQELQYIFLTRFSATNFLFTYLNLIHFYFILFETAFTAEFHSIHTLTIDYELTLKIMMKRCHL